ncbi:alpha/beta hydrolase [Oceanihabitans sp. 2_MG-2023]|uniref:alpha/beta fold hydrolase n=1 Tax=Oceanihabitans sp. 2_MG-2023 TaxID=3062661 RepID=UPI0026E28BD0|nr:alpha/beta hydrolase [Oceanihabitans sp. 2_MG-2023]MDO6595606.1 alpha/beta hydrolase [Oceanihabitans sp. 2_MG-2023]
MILEHKGINLFYTDQGEGTAIILLHGFLENNTMWHALLPSLTKKHRVICIDLLGHGKTPCLGYVHTMEEMAEAVLTVLKHLRLRRYYMIGHSMGGYVALAFAEKSPETLKGLCLMNSTYQADGNEMKQLRSRANKMVQTNFNNMVRMSFANLFSEKSKTIYKTAFDTALKEALKTPVQGYIACQEGMRLRPDRQEVFKSLNCKKLIIIGENDPVVDGEKLVEETKNTNIETAIFSEGHMSHIENHNSLLNAIMHFIE